jgi:CheY-like chemotaxis protein
MLGKAPSQPLDALSGSLAHRLNNPLTAVIANLEVAMRQLTELSCPQDQRIALEGRLSDAHLAAQRLHGMLRELTHLTLPVSTVPPNVDEALCPAPRARILVIDDERLITTAVERALELDHDVVAVGDAEQALHELRSGARFDVILCDLMLPQMTGMDLHDALSQLAPDQALRMVFFTGGAFSTRARSFLEAVPNIRIEKPFDTQSLRELVNERLSQQRP